MSYTRTWDDAIPSGTSQASTIDDSIRALRVDIHERMDDVFNNWLTGPLTLKSAALGTVQRRTIVSPHSGMFANGDGTWGDSYAEATSSGPAWRGQVHIPDTSEITRLQFIVDPHGSTSVTVKLKRSAFNVTEEVIDLFAVTTTTPGVQLLDSGSISITTAIGYSYFIQINGDFTYRYYGAQVVYNVLAVNG